jgi:hypothetical protein
MSDVVGRLRSSLSWPSLRSVVTAPFRRQTYGNLVYLTLAFPLGIAYFVFVSVGLSLSVGLSILLIGVPLFLAVLLLTMALVTAERWLANVLLGVDVDAPDWRVADRDGPVDGAKLLVLDPAVWLGLLFLATKLLVGVAAFTLLMMLLVPTLALVATPLYFDTPGVQVGVFLPTDVTRELSLYVPWNELLVGVSFVVRFTSWQVTTLGEAFAVSALGLVAFVLALNVLNGAAWLSGQWARLVLGTSLVDRLD